MFDRFQFFGHERPQSRPHVQVYGSNPTLAHERYDKPENLRPQVYGSNPSNAIQTYGSNPSETSPSCYGS